MRRNDEGPEQLAGAYLWRVQEAGRPPRWHIAADGRELLQSEKVGFYYLETLVRSPGQEIHVLDLELSRRPPGPAPVTAGTASREFGELSTVKGQDGLDVLDPQAKAAYRLRLKGLDERIRDASSAGDASATRTLEDERDWLVKELSRAEGLLGRSRTTSSAEERVRPNIKKRLQDVLKEIGEKAPSLAAQLDASISTGRWCVYRPGTPPVLTFGEPYGSHRPAAKKRPTLGFFRRRCRLLVPTTTHTLNPARSLMSEGLAGESLEELERQITVLARTTYDRVMGSAALAEALGRIGDMREILATVQLTGEEENTRLLYLAIAEEKGGHLEESLRLLFRVMVSTDEPLVWRAAQFNARVTHEKMDDFDRADFMPFVRDRNLALLGEPLWLKAVSMELISCTRSGRRCSITPSEIEEAFAAELATAPGGSVKTLINWSHYREVALTNHDLELILQLQSRTRVNVRAGLLFELWSNTDDETLKTVAQGGIEVLARETKDPTILRYLEKM